MKNEMKMEFDAVSENEGFARVAVAAFITPLDPTIEDISDVKTAVSEAVTNAVIHGYGRYKKNQNDENEMFQGNAENKIWLHCRIQRDVLHIEVKDLGKGIENVEQAMEPLFTTLPDQNRSGMGFSFMEAFMDEISVESEPEQGTLVKMQKEIGKGRELWTEQSL